MTTLQNPSTNSPPATGAAETSGKKLLFAGALVVVLVVLGVLAGVLPRHLRRAALAVETRELGRQTVSVGSPASGDIGTSLLFPAEVRPFVEVPVYARTSGYLKRWLVDIGAKVQEGDLLAEIDTPELNQELAQAKAMLAQAEAGLELARTTAARWAELLKTASVSEQEAAEKQADLNLKLANVEAARSNVRRLEELQSFELVKAPFAGTVVTRGTDVGQLITAGSARELFRLAQVSVLRVYVRVPQSLARSVVAGQKAELDLPELPAHPFPAQVVRTAGAMNAESRTLLVELQVDNARREIYAGCFAQVRFTDARPAAALALPSNTLLVRPEGTQVGVVNDGGKVELRKVTLGRDFGSTVEILEGVSPADRIILNPSDSLVAGTEVRVAEPSRKEASGK
jgi:membrane fusion protein, multidrug efflux system